MNLARALSLLAGVALVGLAACTPTPPKPTVLIYGDSLTVLSESAANYLYPGERLVFRAQGGTAMCDWSRGSTADRAIYHPTRVVLAFTGNVDGCIRATGTTLPEVVANYESNLRTLQHAFRGLPITVLAPPAMDHHVNATLTAWFPYNGAPELGAMYARVSAELGMTYSHSADDSLTPGHTFRFTGPRFFGGPVVALRASDGIHLTAAGAAWYGWALGA